MQQQVIQQQVKDSDPGSGSRGEGRRDSSDPDSGGGPPGASRSDPEASIQTIEKVVVIPEIQVQEVVHQISSAQIQEIVREAIAQHQQQAQTYQQPVLAKLDRIETMIGEGSGKGGAGGLKHWGGDKGLGPLKRWAAEVGVVMADSVEEAVEKGWEVRALVENWLDKGFGFAKKRGIPIFIHGKAIKGDTKLVVGGEVVLRVVWDTSRDQGGYRATEARSVARWEEERAMEAAVAAARAAVVAAEGSKRAVEELGGSSLRAGWSKGSLWGPPGLPGLGQGGVAGAAAAAAVATPALAATAAPAPTAAALAAAAAPAAAAPTLTAEEAAAVAKWSPGLQAAMGAAALARKAREAHWRAHEAKIAEVPVKIQTVAKIVEIPVQAQTVGEKIVEVPGVQIQTIEKIVEVPPG